MAPPSATGFEIEGVTDTTAVVVPDPILSNGNTHPIFTTHDVLPHRQKSGPMPAGVAAFGSGTMFKSKGNFDKPKAKRWDHRFTLESASRKPSSLKGAMKYIRPDMISLCGGLPSSDYFPFQQIDITIPTPPQFSEAETAATGHVMPAGKHDIANQESLYDLSVALNYGQSQGPPQLLRYVTEHTEIVHNPPYSDWDISMTVGSTSALEMAFRMFGTRGDYLLTEEYTFSSAIETALPLGLKVLGIKMDEHGLLPSDLDEVLSSWDESARGGPKPFLLYTVPTGQNPTSSTQPLSRRKQIYALAEKHDLFILEDEPYYFLQMEPYVSGHIHSVPTPFEPAPIEDFLSSLIPSYLSLDTSGRVLRLDSFSKIIAPGARCGWVTGPAHVVERFIRHAEVSVQTPSGFGLVALYKLLEEGWGHSGFLEWLMYIRAEYTRRRDLIVDACERYLPSIATWSPPAAGMFHWIRIDLARHPSLQSTSSADSSSPESKLDRLLSVEESIFLAGVAHGVLLSRGSWFRAVRNTDTDLFFRTTFAAASADRIVEAVRRFGDALRQEFHLEELDESPKMNGHVNGNGH